MTYRIPIGKSFEQSYGYSLKSYYMMYTFLSIMKIV